MKWICILPIGDIERGVLLAISKVVEETFGRSARLLDKQEEPDFAYDPKRKQYLSIPILKKILECIDEDAEKILGIVNVDIFVPVLRFIFGQAQLDGRAAVVSLARLRQEFYSLPEDRSLLILRAGKEAVHELGHTYGLIHCKNPNCVMHYSNSLREVDTKPSHFCVACLSQLTEKIARMGSDYE
jgi:archaemetzincin